MAQSRVFVSGNPLQSSLMFAGKGSSLPKSRVGVAKFIIASGAYQSGAPFTNTRLGWQKALAYFCSDSESYGGRTEVLKDCHLGPML
jgi:hypothetical protein